MADDEPAVLALYRHGLPAQLPGLEIATVTNGSEAIAYSSSHPVTVLVTDIAMPARHGFEVLAFVGNHYPSAPCNNHVRTIHTPLTALLLAVLRAADEGHRTAPAPASADPLAAPVAAPNP